MWYWPLKLPQKLRRNISSNWNKKYSPLKQETSPSKIFGGDIWTVSSSIVWHTTYQSWPNKATSAAPLKNEKYISKQINQSINQSINQPNISQCNLNTCTSYFTFFCQLGDTQIFTARFLPQFNKNVCVHLSVGASCSLCHAVPTVWDYQ